MMVDSTLVQVGKNLSEAMRILGNGDRALEDETEKRSFSRSIPGPLQGDGQDVATILHLVHNLIHEKEDEEKDQTSQCRMQNVGEQAHMALLGHSLAAYISVLDRERLRKLTTRIQSDTTLWLCRLFRYENSSAAFHEDDRDGLVKVCRLVINSRYEEYASEGYASLTSKQPVIYHSASGRSGLGQHLCSQLGLPLSSLCTVPCNTIFGSQHQMDVALLDKLIKEDIEAGKLPLLLIANAGTPGAGHTDKLGRLKDLCEQYNMWLHVEGVNLATLVLAEINSTIMAATRCDSMTLTPGQWLGLPAVTAVTLYRHEDPALSLAAGLTSSQPVAKLRALPLWLSLQYLGHNGIVQKIKHATSLSHQLLQKLKTLAFIRTSVESNGGSVEGYCAGEKDVLDTFNKWLGERLIQLVPTSGVDVVELEDEGTCVRFSPLLTAAVLGTEQEDIDSLVEKLSELVSVMSSTLSLRQDFREEVHRHSPSLIYVEELSWPGLGAVRYEPQIDGIDESRRKEGVKKINSELLKKLQEFDTEITFSTGPEFSTETDDCIFVGMVTEDVDIIELVNMIGAIGRDIEESGRLLENMTDVIRKGILEAEVQLQKASEEKLMEEGVIRQLPLFGSVLNWFSPVQSSIKGRTFNLVAGSLDSTELTYSTKAQAGRPLPQEMPTSSTKRLSGQRLFQRVSAGTDSFSETSSIAQVEEPSRDGCASQSSSVHPPISLSAPRDDIAADATPQVDSQIEVHVSSEEKQPEDQELDHSER
ncbi:Pyridoxal-dependent decarboxylase domain-containing protein 1 [Takifugu flavidus]|uniref:Pyridoxal-dependent decarboxylase domain-containing protein 1 n=1 Tax=Takifugu flavidus TaxID=433684 RepID=A0A5C6NRL3_9TELE|nr:Pyridoxal-dependent decarboxylase domain-containing protein 1 [Takifugu flavidus]